MHALRILAALALLLLSVLAVPVTNTTQYLDPALYRSTVTTRGLKYQYYYAPAVDASKPTLLLCHGYPSFSQDWRRIAPQLEAKGYGVLAVDMLGYHGTARPLDPHLYLLSRIAQDLVDVLDAEKLDRVVAVGHDWGSAAVSRLSNYHPDRFLAYAFFAVQYLPVEPPANFTEVLAAQMAQFGYELYGYWFFYVEKDANAILQEHMDSFVSIIYPYDPIYWETRLAPLGALKKNLLANFLAPHPAYISEPEIEYFKAYYRANGFDAPDAWYKIMTSNLAALDDEQIPAERQFPPASAPVFYGGVKQDRICLFENALAVFDGPGFAGHNVTIKEYDSDHWVILSHADDIVSDLDAWLQDAGLA